MEEDGDVGRNRVQRRHANKTTTFEGMLEKTVSRSRDSEKGA